MALITKEEAERQVYGRSEPHIYSFRIDDAPNYTKVGDTYRPIYVRKKEWEDIFGTLKDFTHYKASVKNNVYVRDYAVHQYLLNKKGNDIRMSASQSKNFGLPYYSREFFNGVITPDDVDEALRDIKQKYEDGNFLEYDYYDVNQTEKTTNEKQTFKLREDQEEVVKRFVNARNINAENNKKNKLLMYAVMRFGKSFTAMHCALAMDAKHIVIVSAKKDVINEWKQTVKNHIDFEKYEFFTTENLATIDLAKVDKYVVCLTLQGLQKEIRERERQLFSQKIDLLIIDEAHYGAGGDIQGRIVANSGNDIAENKDTEKDEECVVDAAAVEKMIEEHHLDVDTKLFLSGTPYHILWSNEFDDESIIATKRYVDIIKKKREIAKKLEEENRPEWENEYYGFPEMLRFAFNLNSNDQAIVDKLKEYGYSAALSELFRTEKEDSKYKFVHEKDVLKVLKAIDGKSKEAGILDILNFSAAKEDRICRHIVMTFNQKSMCNAMESLILDNENVFKNLNSQNYKIINISGKGHNPDIKDVQDQIKQYEKAGQKTISLTVRRMMTGVTVPEWDTMIMFKSTKSPEEYDQAIFRLQSAHTKKTFINENCKNTEEKYVVEDLKPQTIVVDFDLNRMFHVQEYSSMLQGYGTSEEHSIREKLENDIKYAPIIAVNAEGGIKQVEAIDIVKEITAYSKDKGIVEEVNGLPFDVFALKNNDEFLKIVLAQNELRDSKGNKFDSKAYTGPDTDIDLEKVKDFLNSQEGIINNNTNSPTKKEKENIDGLKNKYKMLVSKLLFFAFLSEDSIETCKGILEHIESSDPNKRIAKNLGLNKKLVETFINAINESFRAQIDEKIGKANILSQDDDLLGVDKVLVSLNKFDRFSDSEVATPIETCSNMLNAIGIENLVNIVNSGNKILDIASKHGEFAYALYNLLKGKVGEDQLKNTIYSIPTSPIAYEFTRKLYSQLRMSEENIADFTYNEKYGPYALLELKKLNTRGNPTKEIDCEKITRILSQKKPFNEIKLSDEPQEGETEMIKIDAIVGNPPYTQIVEKDVDSSASKQLFQEFIIIATKVEPKIVSLITPSRWFVGGEQAGYFPKLRKYLKENNHVKTLVHYPNHKDIFPSVNIPGGVNYFVYDRDYTGKTQFIVMRDKKIVDDKKRDLFENGFDIVFADRRLFSIVKKVITSNFVPFNTIVGEWNSFGIVGKKEVLLSVSQEKSFEGAVTLWCAYEEKRYTNINNITSGLDRLNCWKVFTSKGNGGAGTLQDDKEVSIIGKSYVAGEMAACTDSLIPVGKFETEDEAINCCNYMKTKFLRCMVGVLKVSQNIYQNVYKMVPLQDFSNNSDIKWKELSLTDIDAEAKEKYGYDINQLDAALYKKYNLDLDEIAYIESMIKPME